MYFYAAQTKNCPFFTERVEDSWPIKSRERDLKSNKELIDLHPIPGKGKIGGPIGLGQQVDPLHKSTHTDGISPISVWLSRQTQQKTEGCSNINNQCFRNDMEG